MAVQKNKLQLDASQFLNSLEQALQATQKVEKALKDSLGGDVKADVDTSGIDNALKELQKLKKEASGNVSSKVNVEDSEINQAEKKIEGLDGKDVNVNIKADSSGLDSLKDSLGGAFSGGFLGSLVGGGLAGLAEAGIGAIVSGLGAAAEAALELNRAIGDLEAKTGATGEEFEKLQGAAERAFLDGVGESVAEATDIIANAQVRLGDFLNPEELGAFTGQAQALANTFDLDINEVIGKASPLIKQFGLDGDEAFNIIAGGLQNATTPSDDLLDTLAEYSPLAQEAGFQADNFTQKLITAGDEGTFNLDKVGDSIKEAQIRLKAGDFATPLNEMSAAASGAEKAVIDSVNAIAERAQSGDISIKDALQLSGAEIQDALDAGEISSSLASQLQVAIAGTPAEDLGVDLYSKVFAAEVPQSEIDNTFQSAGDSISKAIGQYTSFEEITRQFQLVFEQVSAGLVQFADTFVTPVIGGILEIVGSVKDAFTDAFGGLGDVFEGEGSFDALQTFQNLLSGIVTFLEARIVPVFEFAFGLIATVLESVLDALSPLFNLFSKLGDLFTSVSTETSGFRDILSDVADVLVEVGGFIFDLLIAPLEIAINIFTTIVTEIADFVAGLFGGVDAASFFNDAISKVGDVLNNIKGTIGGVRAAFDALIDALTNFDLSESLEALISGENPFSGITDQIGDAYDKGFNKATGKYEEAAKDQKKISEELFDNLQDNIITLDGIRGKVSNEELARKKQELKAAINKAQEEEKINKRQVVKLQNLLDQIKVKDTGLNEVGKQADSAASKVKNLSNVFENDFKKALDESFNSEPIELKFKLPTREELDVDRLADDLFDGVAVTKELKEAITGVTFEQEQLNAIDSAIDKLEKANQEITNLNLLETPQFFKALSSGQEEFIKGLSSITSETDDVLKDLESQKSGLQAAFLGAESDAEKEKILKQINDINSQIIDRTIETANITNEDRKKLEQSYLLFKERNEKEATNVVKSEFDEQIKANNEQINTLKDKRKELVSNEEDLLDEQARLREELQDKELSEQERQQKEELKSLADSYAEKLAVARGNEQLYNDLIEDFNEQRQEIIARGQLTFLEGLSGDISKIFQQGISGFDVSELITNNKEVDKSIKELEETYKDDTDALREQLNNKEISQEEYYENLRDLETEYNEQSKELNNERISFFDVFGNAVASTLKNVSELFKSTFDSLAEDLVTFKGTTEEQTELIGNALTAVGASVAGELGAALAQGELTFGKFITTIIDGVQAAITALLAQLIMQKEIETFFGPGIGTAGALAIYGVATGLLQGAKALIGGAEEGVVGLSESNKGKPGRTDTIPMMLAPGEAVINSKDTQKNKGILQAINEGKGWQDYAIKNIDPKLLTNNFQVKLGGKESVSMKGVETRLDRLEGAIRGQTKKIKADVRQVGKTTNKVDVNIRSKNYLY